MKNLLKYSAVALLALATFVPAASARGFYGGGRFYGGVGMGFYPGYWGYGWGPWYGPYYGYGYYGPNAGEVEIKSHAKGDQIFVDRGYAGRIGELKSFPLRVGTHTIELRNANGQTYYQQQVNVIAGKKIKITSNSIG